MIAREVFEEIRGLLTAGNYSQRTIARRLGVSRGTVQAVARGKRILYGNRLRSSGRDIIAPLKQMAGTGFYPPDGMHVRCPGCGGKVQMPCLACYLRKGK